MDMKKFNEFINESRKKKPSEVVIPKEHREEGAKRSDFVFQPSDEKVKDNGFHFPIHKIENARNALARVNQYSKSPSWYDGSLKEVVDKVVKAVSKKYPSIKISKDAKKIDEANEFQWEDDLMDKGVSDYEIDEVLKVHDELLYGNVDKKMYQTLKSIVADNPEKFSEEAVEKMGELDDKMRVFDELLDDMKEFYALITGDDSLVGGV